MSEQRSITLDMAAIVSGLAAAITIFEYFRPRMPKPPTVTSPVPLTPAAVAAGVPVAGYVST